MDHDRFAGVPATVLARSLHEGAPTGPSPRPTATGVARTVPPSPVSPSAAYFHADGRPRAKVGSLQQYLEAEGSADDHGPGLFSVEAVQRVAQLDLRCERGKWGYTHLIAACGGVGATTVTGLRCAVEQATQQRPQRGEPSRGPQREERRAAVGSHRPRLLPPGPTRIGLLYAAVEELAAGQGVTARTCHPASQALIPLLAPCPAGAVLPRRRRVPAHP